MCNSMGVRGIRRSLLLKSARVWRGGPRSRGRGQGARAGPATLRALLRRTPDPGLRAPPHGSHTPSGSAHRHRHSHGHRHTHRKATPAPNRALSAENKLARSKLPRRLPRPVCAAHNYACAPWPRPRTPRGTPGAGVPSAPCRIRFPPGPDVIREGGSGGE